MKAGDIVWVIAKKAKYENSNTFSLNVDICKRLLVERYAGNNFPEGYWRVKSVETGCWCKLIHETNMYSTKEEAFDAVISDKSYISL